MPSDVKFGAGIQLTVSRSGGVFWAPAVLAANSEGPYVAVRAGTVHAADGHQVSAADVDNFLLGGFTSAGISRGSVSTGYAPSFMGNWRSEEFGWAAPPANGMGWSLSVSNAIRVR
jgi:hypothetical protein